MPQPKYKFATRAGAPVDPLEGIVPIFRSIPQGLEMLGTGFLVTPLGILITAAHVVKEWRPDGDFFIFQKKRGAEDYAIRRPTRIVAHELDDLAIVALDPLLDNNGKGLPGGCVSVSLDVPGPGEKISCWGYPQTMVFSPTAQFDGPSIALERVGAKGIIGKHYVDGRDRLLQPGECIETTLDTMGGASGGPVFNSKGKAFAVVSSGIDGGTTYITPIRSALLTFILDVPDGLGGVKAVNLYEASLGPSPAPRSES